MTCFKTTHASANKTLALASAMDDAQRAAWRERARACARGRPEDDQFERVLDEGLMPQEVREAERLLAGSDAVQLALRHGHASLMDVYNEYINKESISAVFEAQRISVRCPDGGQVQVSLKVESVEPPVMDFADTFMSGGAYSACVNVTCVARRTLAGGAPSPDVPALSLHLPGALHILVPWGSSLDPRYDPEREDPFFPAGVCSKAQVLRSHPSVMGITSAYSYRVSVPKAAKGADGSARCAELFCSFGTRQHVLLKYRPERVVPRKKKQPGAEAPPQLGGPQPPDVLARARFCICSAL
jgi:hypothetical protein